MQLAKAVQTGSWQTGGTIHEQFGQPLASNWFPYCQKISQATFEHVGYVGIQPQVGQP